ncbi:MULTISPECIES: TolC family protein [Oxalobacteraceae]|uniref:TolC family protein n=1 Tax=Oxalobacteraceae TaxID=75682 RepID=UPI0002AE9BFF|nr:MULTISPECIES: TolC family protein [Oxalobacteraceae]ELX08370.1 outer membrane efflux protein [Janthinobacterium sp. HH01]OEZ53792.1 outer membrane efflux protein [Duganella sp. HH105]OFA00826.1 outer membrane efflux protein [Duganella sp. HH101]
MLRLHTPLLSRTAVGLGAVFLAGCASLSSDGGLNDVSSLTKNRVGQTVQFKKDASSNDPKVQELLSQPLTVKSAVQIALLNSSALKASFAELGVAEADFVQAGRMRNPGFSFSRVRGGGDAEINRSVTFDIAGLLTLPMRTRIEKGRFEQAKLLAAAQAVQLAADTRRAYFTAVAAAQSAAFAEQVRGAAEASSDLAESMSKVGNWSKLDQAREHAFYQDAVTQLARTRHEAIASREQLIRLLGLWGKQQEFVLPDRLPELPAQPQEINNAEAQALSQRLDVLAARRETEATASALGLTKATAFVNVFDAGYTNKSSTGLPRENGYEVSLELPIFDWGGAKVARAESLYMQSVHRTTDTAVRARSEVREAYSAYRTTYDIARHYRDDVVPLRKKISDEVLLRYNGMLASVFELLADSREQLNSVNTAIETQRDFWIAETKLQSAINGGSNTDTRNIP